ncbi:MAG TPA: response regulator transcription factor [Terriglobales bacterium]|nr:response regulator transcription factor [Terriglobales bacterium]
MAVDQTAKIAVLSKALYRAESLVFTLERTGIEAVVAPNPGLEILSTFGTVLIDLDWGMDNALQLTHDITALRPDVKIVLLGLIESEENVLRLAEFGGAGYTSSTSSLEELISVVQSVQRGEFACAPHITYALFSHLAELARSNAASLIEVAVLTTRERQIMHLLSKSLSNREIAKRLCLSEHTVKNHVHHILKKLGMRNRTFAVRSYSYPLVFEGPGFTLETV